MIDPIKFSRAASTAPATARTSASPGTGLAGTAPSATVSWHGGASSVQPGIDARALAAGAPPFDDVRVDSIRAAIAEGRYPVDPVRVAAAMVLQDFGA